MATEPADPTPADIEGLARAADLLSDQSLLRMHAPETEFEYAANFVIPHVEGSRTPLLHRQDVHLLDFPRR